MSSGRPAVFRLHRGKFVHRQGRGFSRIELEGAQIGIERARKLGILIDPRRKTTYKSNLNILKELLLRNQGESVSVEVAAETG